jgi:CRISPR-associated exonuclease Cas4
VPSDASSDRETPILSWERLQAFVRVVEDVDLYGLSFQHVSLCERRAWFHLKRIDCAHLDERMALGTVLHALSRARDRTVDGLAGLNPDRIDWEARIVFEAKAGAGAVEAVSDQTALYAVLLTVATGYEWRAATHLIRQKRVRPVGIDSDRLERLWRSALRLEALASRSIPPPAEPLALCPACSYRHLCWD